MDIAILSAKSQERPIPLPGFCARSLQKLGQIDRAEVWGLPDVLGK